MRCAAVALVAYVGVFHTQAGAQAPLNPPVTIHVDDTVHTFATDMRDLVEAFVPVTVSTVTIANSVPGYPEATPATAGDLFLVPTLSTGTPQVSGSLLGGTPEQSTFGTFTQGAPATDLVLRLGDGTPVAAEHVGPTAGSLFAGTYYFEVPPTFTDATLKIDLGTIGPQGFNDGSGQTASANIGPIGPISIAVPVAQGATDTSRPLFGPGGIAGNSFPWVELAIFVVAIALTASAAFAVGRSIRNRRLTDELIGTAATAPPEHLRIPAADLIAYLAVTDATALATGDLPHTRHAQDSPDFAMPAPIALPPVPTNSADLEPRTRTLVNEVAEPTGEPVPGRLIDALVMGPIEIDGLLCEPSRPVTAEIAVFLCLHPHREFSADELAGLIWEGRAVGASDHTVRTYMGYVRQAVGSDRLLDARKAGYRLAGPLDSDWRRFEALFEAARLAKRDEPTEAVRLLTAALSLVRGQPFTRPKGVRGDAYSWAQSSGLVHQMGAAIEDAAHLAVELLAKAGDTDGARWAIAQGLRGTRYSVVLCSDRLRIETDRAGLERSFKAVKAILGKGASDVLPVYDEMARKIR